MNKTLGRTALLIALADLALKLLPLGPDREIMPELLRLTHLRNPGVSFGLQILSPMAILALTSLLIVAFGLWARSRVLSRFEGICLGLMLGGALGNLVDRAINGAVLDYLELIPVPFPAFNLADACLSVGAVLLALAVLKPARSELHG